MANGKGRHRSRLYVRFCDRGVKKLCVSEPFTDEQKEELAGLIEARLADTQLQPGRKRLADPGHHWTTVEFKLGVDGLPLDTKSVRVSLTDLQAGRTGLLFARLEQAREEAMALLGPKPQPQSNQAATV